ncbi:MAG: hypothetical protein WD553_01320, partial [Gemmatimonadaceae bacterium]
MEHINGLLEVDDIQDSKLHRGVYAQLDDSRSHRGHRLPIRRHQPTLNLKELVADLRASYRWEGTDIHTRRA